MVASHMLPTGDLARNTGMCPDWESNRRPFVLQVFIIREKRREGEKEGEKHQLVAPHMPPKGNLVGNPGMCLDRVSNQ